jgi:hypothetical protein
MAQNEEGQPDVSMLSKKNITVKWMRSGSFFLLPKIKTLVNM